MNILVTGGAGYIGSHVAKQLLQSKMHNITVLDSFKTGFEATIKTLGVFGEFEFIEQDLSKWQEVETIFQKKQFDVVIHFVTSLLVGESVENPLKYYMNNTCNTANLVNPYGNSKLMSEQIIKDSASANKEFKYAILRYFNVAGAEESLRIGECHEPETHLIPLVVQTELGKREKIFIFGDDLEFICKTALEWEKKR